MATADINAQVDTAEIRTGLRTNAECVDVRFNLRTQSLKRKTRYQKHSRRYRKARESIHTDISRNLLHPLRSLQQQCRRGSISGQVWMCLRIPTYAIFPSQARHPQDQLEQVWELWEQEMVEALTDKDQS
jgi:hypothetical protein